MLFTVKLHEIKTPTTVEEFRDNLKRYYMGCGHDALYVRTTNTTAIGIPLKDISCFDDIYRLTQSGFGGDGTCPSIAPFLDIDLMSEMQRYMNATGKFLSYEGYWERPDSDFTIYDFTQSTIDAIFETNLSWYTLDNQVLRDFYMHTLGEFIGYCYA